MNALQPGTPFQSGSEDQTGAREPGPLSVDAPAPHHGAGAPAKDASPSSSSNSSGAPEKMFEVRFPIEDSIDLHTFAPKETASVVEEYIHEAHRLGLSEVRVIHGRGKGVQRRIARGVLSRHPRVEGFSDAPPARGGWGATIVHLRKAR